MNAVVPIHNSNAEAYRASTDAASLCKAIVVNSAMTIQNRKYVKVEGWQAIAIAHGCTGSARDVEVVEGGVRAVGEIRRMSDGTIIATAEGFVGEDEPTWYGGTVTSYGKSKTLPKRPDYAIRAMAQTRAISRACRSAFAHVVVMMDAGLSTTPAEEVPLGGFDDEPREAPRNITPKAEARRREPEQVIDPPPANQPVDRTAQAVPPPSGDFPPDWEDWRKIIVAKINRATSPEQVATIQQVNADALAACAKVLDDTVERLSALVDTKLAKLAEREAEAA
jgi:hypothetical protein